MLRDWKVGEVKGKKADDEMLIGKAYTYAKQKVQWRTRQRVKGQNDDIWVDTRKLTKDELEKLGRENAEIKAGLAGAEVKKVITVAPKLVNFVI